MPHSLVLSQMLRVSFRAADADGNKSLDWSEFSALVRHTAVSVLESNGRILFDTYNLASALA